MATPKDIIKAAMRKLGKLASGENPTNNELEDGRTEFNRLVSRINADGWLSAAQIRTTATLAASTASYTIGTGATINLARPNEISGAGLIRANDTNEKTIRILTAEEWQGIVNKSQTGVPYGIFYQRNVANGTIYPFYVPDDAHTLVLYTPTRLTALTTTPSDLTTDYVMGDGYEDMFVWNIALKLAPEYGKGASPEVLGMIRDEANASMRIVREANSQPMQMASDPAMRQGQHRYYSDINAFNAGRF